MRSATFGRAIAVIMALTVSMLLATAVRTRADAPRISYVTAGGRSTVVIGSGFDKTSRVLVWNPAAGANEMLKYAGDLRGPAALPATPPADARNIPPLSVTSAMVLNVSLPDGPQVMWVKNGDGVSPPRLVNAPQIWLVTDDEPAPGDQMRIFGRNFCLNEQVNANRMVIFRNAATGKTTIARVAELSEQDWQHTDDHVIGVIVPADLAPGPYDIQVHATDTGGFGWSAPYRVNVGPHSSLPALFCRPDEPTPGAIAADRVAGAAGDGLHDDTQAIQSAMDRAAAAGGGVVSLPPGEYAIDKTLHIPAGVFLRGSGAQSTSIIVSPNLPLQVKPADDPAPYFQDQTPMIWIETQSGISDISLIGGPGVKTAIFLCPRDRSVAQNVSIVRTNVSTPERLFLTGGANGDHAVNGLVVLSSTRHFTIFQCHFRCANPIFVDPSNNYMATITNNTFEVFPRQSANNVGFSGVSYSVIEDNDFIGGSRAIGFSGASNNNWVFNNRITDDGGWANAEEMFMFEGGASYWGGACQTATPTTIQGQGAHWEANRFAERSRPVFVFIKLGTGFGELRRVTANTADTITVDAPWDIVPDATTRFAVLPASYHNLYVNDQTIDCNGRCEFAYGSLLECVIEGLNTRDSEGISSTAVDGGVVAYNDYSYNRLIGMSGIHLSQGGFVDEGIIQIPGADTGPDRIGDVIGNTIRYNEVMDFKEYALNQYGTYWDNNSPRPDQSAGISVDDGSFNIIDDNYVTKGSVGIRVVNGAGNLVINDRIEDVLTPIQDRSHFTHIDGNKITEMSPQGAGAAANPDRSQQRQ